MKKKQVVQGSPRDTAVLLQQAHAALSNKTLPDDAALAAAVQALATQVSLSAEVLESIGRLKLKIQSLTFGTDALREALDLEITRLPVTFDPEVREKILDRIHGALKSRAPAPPPPMVTGSALVQDGKILDVPKSFLGVEL